MSIGQHSSDKPASSEELLALLVLHLAEGLGPATARKLLSGRPSAQAVLQAGPDGLARAGCSGRWARSLFSGETLRRAEAALWNARIAGLSVTGLGQPGYPRRLEPLPDAPLVLFGRGRMATTERTALAAIVGTRTPTPYGRRVAEEFGAGLAAHGVAVVSGLARGIDSHAHRACLEAGGETVAVLAGGLDRIYPSEHAGLAEEISARGLLLSEMVLGVPLVPGLFPRRNRILSGLVDLVVVVESAVRSGALITAHWALDQGRAVAAVPGQIFSPVSQGPHGLIRDGAFLAESVAALLELLPETGTIPERPELPLPRPEEAAFLQALSLAGGDPEKAAQALGMDAGRALALTTSLELKGLLRRLGPGGFLPAGPSGP